MRGLEETLDGQRGAVHVVRDNHDTEKDGDQNGAKDRHLWS